MSHISMQKTALDDAECIKAACGDLKLKFRQNAKPKYYQGREADVVCDIVISLPGSNYEVGLKWNPTSNSFDLYYDKWQGHVENVLGKGCEKLVQSAAFHKIIGTSRLMGYVMEQEPVVDNNRHTLFELEHY